MCSFELETHLYSLRVIFQVSTILLQKSGVLSIPLSLFSLPLSFLLVSRFLPPSLPRHYLEPDTLFQNPFNGNKVEAKTKRIAKHSQSCLTSFLPIAIK